MAWADVDNPFEVGRLRVVTGTDPAANTECSDAVTAGKVWKLMAYSVTLATDANVANRNVALVIDDGTTANVVAAFPSYPTNITASLTKRLAWTAASTLGYSVIGQDQLANSLAPDLVLGPGMNIRTVTTNRQAGDNYGAPLLYVVEYTLFDATP